LNTLRERFDIIGFDPRGVGRSRPVQCVTEAAGQPTASSGDALAAFFDDFAKRVAKACVDQNGAAYVTSLSTNNTARDMDMLRQALGEERISFAGVSYGTVVGAVYASMFPERVRAMVLDGGLAPEFRDYLVEEAAEQASGYESTFRHIDQLCQADPQCVLR